jgi:ABC-type molybdate transport system substrate-binding protein
MCGRPRRATAASIGRLAIADPNGVPVGRYGKAALESPTVGTRVERSSRSNLSRWPISAEAKQGGMLTLLDALAQ